MNKNLQAFSIIILGVCIVIGSWFISEGLKASNREVVETQNTNRYELVMIASDYFRMIDKQTGDYWEQVGSRDWIKYDSPISK